MRDPEFEICLAMLNLAVVALAVFLGGPWAGVFVGTAWWGYVAAASWWRIMRTWEAEEKKP